ncbi:hypothetical protein PAAG_05544 [Paracoccidioides lutzii Pb01]|uniref:Uncharacterized protein n=1 Tax=Paracoccidioides lutzii (strain ATCC MYA-826 / Pb01) TaxID=502779 RepID=C1H451_PARBA|nr:hypothetical protein PAAG_05544 [Paracoccidioides lutzii Pb01]EEH34495.2 hypothetical protein PAAG_05544 [Paracoccidioides lutzii Pb01]
MYQCVFGHMEHCIKHLTTPIHLDTSTSILPELIIGSYKPSIKSATAMKMFLFYTMAHTVFSQLQTVLGAHQSKKSRATRRTGSGGRDSTKLGNGDETFPGEGWQSVVTPAG